MKRFIRVSLKVIPVLILIATVLSLLFTGHFDRATFEVEQTSWASPKLVAMVAMRATDRFPNGAEYFVLIGDHQFSARELWHAYYNHGVIFSGPSYCLSVSWKDARNLVISCHEKSFPDGAVGAIEVELRKKDSVSVSYVNIPIVPDRQ